jgi:solute carrier family 6 amino acid transporter-like protein 5/7/9/14
VGYGQVVGSVCVATYYCCLMAITLFYLVHSFTGDLPWGTCQDEWTEELNAINKRCVDATAKGDDNTNDTRETISSSELFFTKEVLKEITDLSDGIGMPEWRLTLCLLVSWVITFLVSVRGVQSSGKASYFLALFPYVIMITLLIRAATLEGAAEGMYYFIKTDWAKLAEPDVWYAAVTQCFFSLNVGFGSIIMFSSYNAFDHNINRDALIVTTLDTFTSLLSGVTIFGILGNLAHNLGVTPDKVINSGGTGLAFISYPDAIAKMEAVPWVSPHSRKS